MVAVQAGDHEVALCAVGQDGIGVHVGHLDDEHILHQVQPIPRLALEGGQPDLMGAVIVIDGTVPSALHHLAQAAVEVGPKECRDEARAYASQIEALLLGDGRQVQQVFRKARPQVHTPVERHFELPVVTGAMPDQCRQLR